MSAIEPVPVTTKRKSFTKAQRVRVFDAAGGLCHICGLPIGHRAQWEVEHVVARERGGSDDLANLRPAHVACHKTKSAEDVKVIAKTRRARAAHLGIKGGQTALAGRDRETRQAASAARRQDRQGPGKLPVPAPRSIYGGRS